MRVPSLRTAAIAVAIGAGLGGCTTYSPFGYGSGISVGYGSPYGSYGYHDRYYDPYSDPYYMGYRSYYGSRFGGYYGSPYGGWYNGYYYPGSGIYVYDRDSRPKVWDNSLEDFWVVRRKQLQSSGVANPASVITTRRVDRNRPVIERRNVRVERRAATATTTASEARPERRTTRAAERPRPRVSRETVRERREKDDE